MTIRDALAELVARWDDGRNIPNSVWAAARAALAQEPATHTPWDGMRKCEFCGCQTNAALRACCERGREADKATSRAAPADDLVRDLCAAKCIEARERNPYAGPMEILEPGTSKKAAAAIVARDQRIAELEAEVARQREQIIELRAIKVCCQNYETCAEQCSPLTDHWKARAEAAERRAAAREPTAKQFTDWLFYSEDRRTGGRAWDGDRIHDVLAFIRSLDATKERTPDSGLGSGAPPGPCKTIPGGQRQ